MQRHGLILADNGSNWYFTGTSEPGWDTDLLDQLKTIPAGAFEAVDTSSLMADADSGRVAASAAPPVTTAPTAPTTTTTRPRATTTTTRPKPTTTTTQPATATTVATTAPEASTTTAPAPESTTTTAAAGVAAPAPGTPVDETEPPERRSRRWWLGVPVGLALAAAIASRKKRSIGSKVEE